MADYDLGTARGTVVIDTASLARAQGALNSFGNGLIALGGLALAGFAVAANAAATFEQRISGFKAVTDASEADLERIRQKALQLGRDTIFSANQVAEGFEVLGKAGLTATEVLNGAGDAATLLAAAGDLKIDRAAEIAANAMRTFGLQAEDLPRVSDLLAAAANRSTLEVEDLATSLKYVGGVASAFGLSIEDTVVALGQLGNAGIRGSTGGTVLRRVLLNLQGASPKAAAALKDLGIITEDGANKFLTAEGSVKSFAEIQGILEEALRGRSDAEKIAAINTIFGNRAVAGALILARDGAEGFNTFRESLEGMTAADVAATRMDNLKGDIEKLKGSIETLLVTVGRPFQDVLRGWVQAIDGVVQALSHMSPRTAELVAQVALYGGAALVATGLTLKLAAAIVGAYKRVRDLIVFFQTLNTVIYLLTGANVLGAIATGISAIGTAIGAIVTAPITLIVLAVAALAAGFILLYNNVQAFHDFFQPMVEGVKTGLSEVQDFVNDLADDWLGFFDEIGPEAEEALGHVQKAFDGVIDTATDIGKDILGVIGRALQGAGRSIMRVWDRLWDEMQTIVSNVWDNFTLVITSGSEIIQRVLGGIIDLINGDWSGAWENFSAIPGIIFNFLVEGAKNSIGLIGAVLSGAKDLLVGLASEMWRGIKNAGEDLLPELIDFAKGLPGKIIDGLGTLADAAKWLWDHGREAVGGLIEGAEEKGRELAEWARGLPGKIVDWVTENIGKIDDLGFDIGTELFTGFTDGLGDLTDYLSSPDGLQGDIEDAIGDTTEWLKEDGWDLVHGFAEGVWENKGDIALAGAIIVGAILLWLPILTATALFVVGTFVTSFIGAMLEGLTGGDWGLVLAWLGSLPLAMLVHFRSGIWSAIQAGAEWIGGLFEGLASGIGRVLGMIAGIPFRIAEGLSAVPGWFYETGRRWLLGGSPGLLPGLESALPSVLNFFIGLPGRLLGALGDFAGRLFTRGFDAMIALGNGLKNAFTERVLPFLRGIPGQIGDAISGIPGVIGSAIGGIRNTIEGAIGGVGKSATGLGNSITQGFFGALLPGSPFAIERWMMQITDTVGNELDTLSKQARTAMDIGRTLEPVGLSSSNLGQARSTGVVPFPVQAVKETGGTSTPTSGGDTYNIHPVNPMDSSQLAKDIMWEKRVRVG